MAKSPEEGMATLLKNLREKTGKSIDEWVVIARSSDLKTHKPLVEFLKTNHALTHGYANQIALRAVKPDEAPTSGGDDPIEAQYSGAKAALRPIYEALIAAVKPLGEFEASPKKGYVSLRATKQFGMIQPTTATRVDLGLILKGVEPSGRLEASGSFNAMFTHRIRIGGLKEVDKEVIDWLRRAYEMQK